MILRRTQLPDNAPALPPAAAERSALRGHLLPHNSAPPSWQRHARRRALSCARPR